MFTDQFRQEEVLKRVDANATKEDKTSDPLKDVVVSAESSNVGLRQLLSDTLPCLFNGLQTIIDERNKAD